MSRLQFVYIYWNLFKTTQKSYVIPYNTRWWAWYVYIFHQQIEGAGQQLSKRTFFKVLERLREWEICSPDICAAIEFCREKIVEMTVEDFEEWFSQQFPKIQRPQTAPVGKKKSRGGDNLQVALQERFPSAYSSRAKSGFRPRGQRSKSGYAFSGRPLSSSTTVTVANPVIKVRPMSMR